MKITTSGLTVSVIEASVGATGAAVPTSATMVGGTDGTNLRALKVSSTGVLSTDGSASTQPVSGTVTVTQATGTSLHAVLDATSTTAVTQATGTNLHTVVDSGTITAVTAITNALPAGSNVIGHVIMDTSSTTAVTQATGSNLHMVVDSGTVTTVSAVTAITNALPTGANVIGAVTQSGTWTVQPGNTANTTAWLVTKVPPSSSTNANTSVASTALEASHVLKASAGRLFQLTGVNTKASAQYIQVFNSATVPADTTVPILLAYVGAGANFSWDFGDIGRYFATGISVSNSSSAATKTIGSADCWFNAEIV